MSEPAEATPARKSIDVGSIGEVTEIVFSQGHPDHLYILQAERQDYLATMQRFPRHDIKVTTNVYIDDTDGDWYACYNVDCFDPPFAVVRARSFEVAYEVFCDEFSKWMAVDEVDAKDYPEDEREYNGSGVHIDSQGVQLYPLSVVSLTTIHSRGAK